MGFALCPWDSLKTQLQCNEDFIRLWRQACESYEQLSQKKPAAFNCEAFSTSDNQGYRVEQPCELLTQDDIQQRFGMGLKDMGAEGVPIDKLKDERGNSVEGILIPKGPKLWYLHASYGTDYSERIHSEGQQLRAGQGADLRQWYRTDLSKVHPLGLGKGGKCIEMSDLEAIASKVKEARRIAEEKAKLFALDETPASCSAAAAAADKAAELAEEKEVDDDDEDSVQYDLAEGDLPLQGPSAKHSKKQKGKLPKQAKGATAEGQRRNKQKSISGSTIAQKGEVHRRISRKAPDPLASCASSALETTSVGSAKANSKDSQSPSEKAQTSYDSNMSALDIEKLLRGEKMGCQRFQAERAINTLGKTKEGAVQKILLQSHLTLFREAESILPGRIHKLSKAERERILENLGGHAAV